MAPDEIKIYHIALSFSDYEAAKNAIFSLIAKNPSRVDYLDSLARIYFSMNAYPQALAAADFVLKNQPDNQQMLELSAICQGAMKNDKAALESYEKLYAKRFIGCYQSCQFKWLARSETFSHSIQ